MDKTKMKLAAFFDNDDEETSFLQKPVDDNKLSQYAAGKVRKSRREKEQEAAEAKKREEEADAAQAYAEFLDAFEGEEVSRRKTGSAFVRAESHTTYIPSGPAAERRPPPPRSISPPATSAPKPKGKRAMDSFLEEIKKEQAEREAKYARHGHGRSVTAMAAYDGQSGSKDRGDPLTTNLFVANLPNNVTEPGLGKFFARIGPVGSVKIMWPRADAPSAPGVEPLGSRRGKNTGYNGFVSFMTRRDAEEALREFDGYDWGGFVLRVGWSKAVPIAAKPLYVSSTTKARASRSRSRSYSPDRHAGHSRDSYQHSRRSRSPSRDRRRSRSPRRRRRYSSSRSHSPRRRHSASPPVALADENDAVTDTFIRAVALEVKGQDAKYEEALREREKSNPKYNFLLRKDHRRHAYYRGLIESEDPKPAFDDDGYNSVYSSDSEEESERKRGEIARCMTFSLEHAEAAHEVADIIVSSLLVDSTAVPRKVARLHLICDILHNSAASVPSAWKFRQEFQARLGIVFDHLANIYHSFPGRITADLFKKQITTIVDIWEDWIVFPPEFTTMLRTRLEGAVIPAENRVTEEASAAASAPADNFSSRFKTSGFKPATEEVKPAEPTSAHVSDSEPMDVSDDDNAEDLDGKPIEEDIDGMPLADDIDGQPVDDDLDGVPVADDIDGIPIGDDDLDGMPIGDNVDGVPVDDDIDGAPVET
ncbi:hypothetical protein D9613_000399 [Agrocybe pediades]|uniref:U2 snRNP-associated SURP motif-containing protein n=1 Tax=Agrocybe pediades TaxID=84607 RepID=A0A8H4QZL1_9AGAR|nr:hypothetical protein D9613_000399 [Agrocybe pediades]